MSWLKKKKMSLLINKDDIDGYRSISENISEVELLEPHIRDAQEFDLKPLLDCSDEEFLQAIIDNQTTYADLIAKIKPVLVYFSYARFLSNHGIHVTPTGVVTKKNADSEPVSEAQLSRIINQAESSALVYQKRLIDHLEDNKTTYTLWKCSSSAGRRKSGARIRAVGGSSSSSPLCNDSWTQFETL